MAKKCVISARGKKVDFAALKAANPKIKPVKNVKVAKTKSTPKTQKTMAAYIPKMSAPTPAKRPVPPTATERAMQQFCSEITDATNNIELLYEEFENAESDMKYTPPEMEQTQVLGPTNKKSKTLEKVCEN